MDNNKWAVVATFSDASYRTWIVWGNRRKAGRLAASIRSGNHNGLMLVSVQPVRGAVAHG